MQNIATVNVIFMPDFVSTAGFHDWRVNFHFWRVKSRFEQLANTTSRWRKQRKYVLPALPNCPSLFKHSSLRSRLFAVFLCRLRTLPKQPPVPKKVRKCPRIGLQDWLSRNLAFTHLEFSRKLEFPAGKLAICGILRGACLQTLALERPVAVIRGFARFAHRAK